MLKKAVIPFAVASAIALSSPSLLAEQAGAGSEGPREISGMSVMGNDDAPRSLVIVPWRSSEIGLESDFSSSLLNEDMVPVDKPVFMRELEFYQVSVEPQ